MKPVITWFIYALKHPRTGQVCYVGWTSRSLKRRLQAHVQQAVTTRRKVRGNAKNRWVLALLSIGLKPDMEVLETGTGDGWKIAEPKWIAFYRAQNPKLLNRSDGGEGNPGCAFSAEARRKISETAKSWKRSPEHIAKWHAAGAAANKGRKRDPELVARTAAKLRGRPRPPEVWEKCRAANKGRIVSLETRARISACHKGTKASPETRAKMRESHLRLASSREPAKGRFPTKWDFWKYTNRNHRGQLKKRYPADFDFVKSGMNPAQIAVCKAEMKIDLAALRQRLQNLTKERDAVTKRLKKGNAAREYLIGEIQIQAGEPENDQEQAA